MSKIYIKKTGDNLLKDFDRLLDIVRIQDFVKKGEKILIKPNICAPLSPSSGGITKPVLVVHLAERIKKLGATPIVGESSIGYGMTHKSFQASGLYQMCKEKKIKLLNLEEDSPIRIDGMKLKVCSVVKKVDKIINFPVMKTHYSRGIYVSLSLKNLMGLLWHNQKSVAHVNGLENSLLELNKNIKPVLNIMDAIIAMEGDGPTRGNPKRLNLIFASEDRVALDFFCCKMMQIKAPSYLMLAEKAGIGSKKAKIVGDRTHTNNFTRAHQSNFVVHQMANLIFTVPLFRKFFFSLKNKFNRRHFKAPTLCKAKCISCKQCYNCCPYNAIVFMEKYPRFIDKKCVKCYACVELCPRGALKEGR